MKNSPDQQTALDKIGVFLHSNEYNFSLTGEAGTGKSHITKRAIKLAEQAGINILYCATTNKAAKVATDLTGYDYQTIHSALKLKPTFDKNTGKQALKQMSVPFVAPNTLAITDEASMIDKELMKYINESAILKVLFVGDSYQLPPVNEGISQALSCKSGAELTTIHRTDKDDIIGQSHQWRKAQDKKAFPPIKTFGDDFADELKELL